MAISGKDQSDKNKILVVEANWKYLPLKEYWNCSIIFNIPVYIRHVHLMGRDVDQSLESSPYSSANLNTCKKLNFFSKIVIQRFESGWNLIISLTDCREFSLKSQKLVFYKNYFTYTQNLLFTQQNCGY